MSVALSQLSAPARREGSAVQRQQVSTVTLLTAASPLLVPLQVLMLCLLRTKIDEINQRKEEEVKAMNLRIQKLQSDLSAANQVRAG